MRSLQPHWVAALLTVVVTSQSVAQTNEGDIEWRHRRTLDAITVMANPLGTASRISFYEARGFTAAMIQPYAQSCGFSLGIQNSGKLAITTHLRDWQAVGADGRRVRLPLPEAWDADWQKAGVSQAARIAFHWAQFQTENRFEPGDWIMGMATLEEPPTAPFSLIVRFHDNKGHHEIALDKLACP